MSNKALKYQLKSIISNLTEEILEKIINSLEQIYAIPIERQIKEKSYKCYEAHILFHGKKYSGFGRAENEAFKIAAKNFLEFLIENENLIDGLKQAITNYNEKENQPKKNIPPLQLSNKEFGNISCIGIIETPQNLCNSLIEIDELLINALGENKGKKNIEKNSNHYHEQDFFKPIKSNKESTVFRKEPNNFIQKKEKEEYSQGYCCKHEEILKKCLNEITNLNSQISNLKAENEKLKSIIFAATANDSINDKADESDVEYAH